MKRIYSCVLLLTVLTVGSVYAQTVGENSGTTSGDFLNIGAGAKAQSMGGAYSALANDVNSLYWNPAGLSQVKGQQALLTHTMWFMDVNQDYAAYVRPLKGDSAFGINVTNVSASFEKRAGDTALSDSNGSMSDLAVGLSYGRQLMCGISGGVTLKYLSSTLDANSAASTAIDLGFQKEFPSLNNLLVGLALKNFGGSLKYVDTAVAIGETMDLGLGMRDVLIRNLSAGLDYTTIINASYASANIGLEYRWHVNGQLSLSPRIGLVNYDSRFTAGLGIGWKSFQFDYALIPQSDLGTSNIISLGMNF